MSNLTYHSRIREKALALVAGRQRFERVGASFLRRIEAKATQAIEQTINSDEFAQEVERRLVLLLQDECHRHPSKGKTLQ